MNAFEALADRQTVSPVKAKLRGADKRAARSRAARDAEKKLAEDDILWSMYRAGKRAELKTMLSGRHGKEVRSLVAFMRTMTLSSAPALVSFIEDARWVRELGPAEREQVWGIVFNGIAKLREKNGLSFWDDSIDGQPRAFDQIERVLRGAS